jgi:hypothetical protein
MLDSLTTCSFLRHDIPVVFGSLDNWGRSMLEGTCGWRVSDEEWRHLMLRVSIMERCLCIREGYVPARDDILPDRFFNETLHGKYGDPKVLDREKFLEARKKTYLAFGLNEDGILRGRFSKIRHGLSFQLWKRNSGRIGIMEESILEQWSVSKGGME